VHPTVLKENAENANILAKILTYTPHEEFPLHSAYVLCKLT